MIQIQSLGASEFAQAALYRKSAWTAQLFQETVSRQQDSHLMSDPCRPWAHSGLGAEQSSTTSRCPQRQHILTASPAIPGPGSYRYRRPEALISPPPTATTVSGSQHNHHACDPVSEHRMSIAAPQAFVCVGDHNGHVGLGVKCAKEVRGNWGRHKGRREDCFVVTCFVFSTASNELEQHGDSVTGKFPKWHGAEGYGIEV